MAIRGCSCAVLFVATLGCGGEEFQSGSGGTSAGGSSSGGTSNGGTGGSGTGGEAGSVNPVGGAGGDAGQSGDGGTGGVIPGCAPKAGAPLMLHTTLDDATSTQTPTTGSGPGTFNGDFGPAVCGNGLAIYAAGNFLSYPGAENINLVTGTVDFFFKPSSGFDNSTRHLLSVPGKFQIVWAQNGDLVVGAGSVVARTIAAVDVPFAVNVWTRITVTWKFLSDGETVQVYFDANGVGGPFGAGPISTIPIDDSYLFIGANGENDPNHADGIIDDVKIYDGTEEP